MSRYEDNNQRENKGKKKKGSAIGTFISTLVLVVALGVFCYAAYTLYGYYKEYKKGTDEYGSLNDRYVTILSAGWRQQPKRRPRRTGR